MGNLEKVKELSDNDWWRINSSKKYEYTYSIEWTPKLKGWVRAKKDKNTEFRFGACSSSTFALQLGYFLIDR